MKAGKKPLNDGKESQVMDFEYFYGKQSSQYAFYRIPKQLLRKDSLMRCQSGQSCSME